LPLRQHDDAEAEAHPSRCGGEVGEGHDRFDARLISGIRRVDRQRDVVADPQRLEAGLLGEARAPHHRFRVRTTASMQAVQGEVHAARHH
jgi:hypothetical protein